MGYEPSLPRVKFIRSRWRVVVVPFLCSEGGTRYLVNKPHLKFIATDVTASAQALRVNGTTALVFETHRRPT